MRRFLVALALLGTALAQEQLEFFGIVPGDQLKWQVDTLQVSLVVRLNTTLTLEIYSPGLDPADYRRGLKGGEELGDERYDGGRGDLQAEFRLTRDGATLVEKTFGTEPHRWVRFFQGRVEPGVYLLTSRFYGLGKNAFRYRITSSVTGAVEVLVDPHLQVLDIRPNTVNVNVRGPSWMDAFRLRVDQTLTPLLVGFYDEDGPRELEARVRLPDGRTERREVSGPLAWVYYQVQSPGTYVFGYRQPETAAQYSNTVGIRVEACLKLERSTSEIHAFQAVPPQPVDVQTVDQGGQKLDLPLLREGDDKLRTFKLAPLPPGYRLLRMEVEGGEVLPEGRVRFGCAGGKVRFMVEKPSQPAPPPPPPQATLELRALAVLPTGEEPFDLRLRVGEVEVTLRQGQARLTLPPGTYPLVPLVEGARVEGPKEVRLEAGGRVEGVYRVYPEVALELEPKALVLEEGQTATFTLRAQTPFPKALPGDLELRFPEGLTPLTHPRLLAPMGRGREGLLRVEVRAERKGVYEVVGSLAPWDLLQRARVEAVAPARLALQVEGLEAVPLGEKVVYTVRVRNLGDRPGEGLLVGLPLAEAGLLGFEERIRLGPGEVWERRLEGVAQGGEILTYTARLLGQEAQAKTRVLRPKASLTREALGEAVPGEEVEVRLRVENRGEAPMAYTLTDTPPPGFVPLGEPRWEGSLAPGEARVHTYRVRVPLGPESQETFLATLKTPLEEKKEPATLIRRLIPLRKEASPKAILLGEEALFFIQVTNPLSRPLTLTLRDAPEEGLALLGEGERTLTLGPKETQRFEVRAQGRRLGELKNSAMAFVNGVPASLPAQAALAVKPVLEPVRLSQIQLPFKVEGPGERLLIAHPLPPGASYERGSARLNGLPIPDPKTDGKRLFFLLPYASQGTLSYTLRHREPLGPLPEASLTLRLGDREVYLKGKTSFKEAEGAREIPKGERPGAIREPWPGTVAEAERIRVVVELPAGLKPILKVNGQPVGRENLGKAVLDEAQGVERLEYYGVPLKEGANRIRLEAEGLVDEVEVFRAGRPVRLALRPLRAFADGRSPVELEVLALDPRGLPSGFGPVTLGVEGGEPLDPDAFPKEPGYQILLKEGRGLLRLKPLLSPGRVRVEARFNDLVLQEGVYVPGSKGTFYAYQGSLGIQIRPLGVFGLARGYLETPLGEGNLQVALDTTGGLARPLDPKGAFPITGAGEEARPALQGDPLAFRYESPRFGLGYHAGALALPGVRGLPSGPALRLEVREGEFRATGFLGLFPEGVKTVEITPDGGRIYALGERVEPLSERVVLVEGAKETPLVRLKDYTLDYPTGTLFLARPLWPTGPGFEKVRLRVTYAPQGAPRRQVLWGFGLSRNLGAFRLGAGVAQTPKGLAYGGEVRMETPRGGLGLRYTYDGRALWALEGTLREESFEARANLTYGGRLEGRAQVRFGLGGGSFLALEQVGLQTGLLYELSLSPWTAGLGVAYLWDRARVAGLLRARLGEALTLTHTQPFGAGMGVTRLDLLYPLGNDLFLEGGLEGRWGEGIGGSLGLRGRLMGSNFSIAYALPGASGEGNRARLGLEVPWPLDERWSLNVSAGYERNLTTGEDRGALGFGVRYKEEGLVATFSADLTPGNLTLKGGLAGMLGPEAVVGLEALLRLPERKGRYSVAYALWQEALTLLTYHRLEERRLEGALALAFRPGDSFQLRPSFAYRLLLGDPQGNTYQVGLAGNLYLTPFLGLGGGAYYLFQPGTGAGAWVFSVEGSVRAMERVWANLGYAFGGQGLTPDTVPGLYLRLDFLGGEP